MKTALIIGISGQDGGYLAKLLLSKGYRVVGTSRDHEVCSFTNLKKLGIAQHIETASMTTSDFRSVLTVLQKAQPDEIYNLAGQTSVGMSFNYPVETFESILIGTVNLLECLRLLGGNVRFYSAGSSEIYGNTESPADEKTAFHPRSPYAAAKAAAFYATANYREAYGLFACTGILFNHESPMRPPRFVTKKIVEAAVRIANGSQETLVLGNLDVCRDWGWAPEYVDAMWKMLQQESPDDYVIATGKQHSLREFVGGVFGFLHLEWEKYVRTDPILFRPSDIQYSCGDASKASCQLQWNADRTFHDILALLVEAELATFHNKQLIKG